MRSETICRRVIEKERTIWDKIDQCCVCNEEDYEFRKLIWDIVFENKKVMPVWENFITYYNGYGLTDGIIRWIDEFINVLIKDSNLGFLDEEIFKTLIMSDISFRTFCKLIKTYKMTAFDCDLKEFEKQKIEVLLQNNYIPITLTYLDELKSKCPELVPQYILKNKEKFIDLVNDKLSQIQKHMIIQILDIDMIAKLIAMDSFTKDEIIKLIELFDTADMTDQMAYTIRNLEFNIEKEYVNRAWELLPEEKRYRLFLNQLEIYSIKEISDKLLELAPVYQKLSDSTRRHREILDVSDYNESLLNKLKKKAYITSYEETVYINHGDNQKYKNYVVWVKKHVN